MPPSRSKLPKNVPGVVSGRPGMSILSARVSGDDVIRESYKVWKHLPRPSRPKSSRTLRSRREAPRDTANCRVDRTQLIVKHSVSRLYRGTGQPIRTPAACGRRHDRTNHAAAVIGADYSPRANQDGDSRSEVSSLIDVIGRSDRLTYPPTMSRPVRRSAPRRQVWASWAPVCRPVGSCCSAPRGSSNSPPVIAAA